MYLQIKGIEGDSTNEAHKNWIELESFSHGVSQPVGASWSAQGAHAGSIAQHTEFSFSKRLDSSSPTLCLYCCNGKAIDEVVFEITRPLGDQTTFMKYTFNDCIISGISTSGSASESDPIPMEQVSIRYSQIKWEYTPTDTKGKKQSAKKAGWNVATNKSV